MKQDLIGRKIGSGNIVWRFASLEEFRTFDIRKVTAESTGTVYTVSVELRGAIGPEGQATVEIGYRKGEDGYRLDDVQDNGTLQYRKRSRDAGEE